jgi:hypothetical protein
VRFRTATGSGVGSSSATAQHVAPRTAAGSGVGSGTATNLSVLSCTATGFGVGSGTANEIELLPRTATGTGAGTAAPANWTKSLIFRTPADDKFPWADYRENTVDHVFFGKVKQGNRARNIYRLTDGTFTNVDPLNPALVTTVYYGGHDYFVTPEEKAILVAAGYTVT